MILWENYKKICFIAPFGVPSWPALAIVTAWNPASQRVGEHRNRRRERAIWCHLEAIPGINLGGSVWGSALDGSWRESSLAVALSLREACELAARFGQNAIYWVEGDNSGWHQY